jgi:hypothetical protein
MTSATLGGTVPLVLAPAVLVRERWGWRWVIPKCPHCGRKHTHGGGAPGEDPRAYLGGRVAHCGTGEWREYTLVEQAAPPWRLTWAELATLEPALAQLEREIRAWARTPLGRDFCANARWYGYGRFKGMGYRARVVALVGWGSRHPDPRLRTSDAYDTAYRHLYELLPDCRECACG